MAFKHTFLILIIVEQTTKSYYCNTKKGKL